MSVPEALLMRSPVESDPGQFDRVAESFEDKDGNGGKDIAALREVLYDYKKDHKGPDINTIALNGHRVALALRSLLRGYDNVAAAFRTAASGIRGLEDGLHDPGGFFSLQRQLHSADSGDSTPMVGEPGGSFDIGSGVGEAERLAQQVKGEYARVQRAEAALLKELQEAIDEAETGELADLDNAALNGVIDEIEAALGEDPDLAGVVEALRRSQLVLADEADGELNTDVDALAEMDHDLAVAIISGEVDVPEDEDGNPDFVELQNQIDAAMAEGKLPSEVRLDPILFPPDYREKALRIAEIERELEEFEGGEDSRLKPPVVGEKGNASTDENDLPPPPTHPKFSEEHKLKVELGELRKEISGGGKPDGLHEVDTAVDTGDYYGDSEWKGERLGGIYKEPENTVSADVAETISEEVVDDPAAGTAFFNEIGAEGTAELPKRHPGASPDQQIRTTDNFSIALGRSSRGEGGAELEFTADEMIEAGTEKTVFLLDSGDFSDEFMTAATVAVLQRDFSTDITNHDEKPFGSDRNSGKGIDASDRPSYNPEVVERYGSDPRNIVLRESAEQGVSGDVVNRLAETEDGLDSIFEPADPFVPDDSRDNAGYPVTDFLRVSGEDEKAAGHIFVHGSKVDEFSDEGVAAGVDAVMGQHATVMYDEEYLGEHGIRPGDRLSQSEFEALGLDKDDWERLQTMVTDHGQGSGLIYGNDRLIREAIANDLEIDGRLSDDDPGYERFGLTSGVLQRNYAEGLLAYNEGLDDDAERRNRWTAATTSGVLALTGVAVGVTGVGAVAATVASVVLTGTDIGLGATGKTSPNDTDNEIRTAEDLIEALSENPASEKFSEIAKEETIRVEMEREQKRFDRGSISEDEVSVINRHGDRVRITENGRIERLEHGKEGSRWVPATEEDMEFSNDPDDRVGRAGNDVAGGVISGHHAKGMTAADQTADKDASGTKRARSDVKDAGVWVPIQEGGE